MDSRMSGGVFDWIGGWEWWSDGLDGRMGVVE